MATTEPARSSRAGKTRVFLADDHTVVQEGLAAFLERTGQFEIAGRCSDGLLVVQQVVETQPDAVVLDVGMPGMNGVDICRELKRRLPGTVVLMLSMHDGEEFILRALEYGAGGYLLKESAGTDLVEALKTAMAGGVYLGPGIDRTILGRLHKPRNDPYDTLSPRERQVLQLIAESQTNVKIAARLGIGLKTVDTHRMRLMKKLDIHDQTTLVKFYLKRQGGLDAAGPPKA